MEVNPATSKHRIGHGGTTFHFCSAGCRSKFEADPDEYLKPEQAAPPTAAQKGAIYTCPMHPEIRQQGPGNCPICGMARWPASAAARPGASACGQECRTDIGRRPPSSQACALMA
jgi:P-type Cu+ transporter